MANKIDKTKTIKKILDKINSSNSFSINIEKFNKIKKTNKFIKECAEFCSVEVVYEK